MKKKLNGMSIASVTMMEYMRRYLKYDYNIIITTYGSEGCGMSWSGISFDEVI